MDDTTKEMPPSAGRTKSEETRRKISAAMKGVPKPDSVREKMSLAKKGVSRPPLSEETKAKMRAAHLGKKHSEETKRKIRDAERGKTKSEEVKRKMSQAKTGRKRPEITGGRHPNAKKVLQYSLDGELVHTWSCMREVADDPNYPSMNLLRQCCQGKRETYNGYRWKYADDKD